MFSPPLQRLLWKDARTLAGVWGLLLAATALLQVALPITSWTGELLSVEDLFAAALVLTGCFAMTAAAMMFAGEREEGTHEWLRQLPVKPWVLVEAKIGLAVVATLLFCGAALLCASAAEGMFHVSSRGSDLQLDLGRCRDSIFGLFAWGLFFSLIDRSVLRVLLCAALAEGVTVYLVWNELADRRPEWGGPVYAGLVGLVAIADGWLAWRWGSGRDPEWVRSLGIDREAPPLLSTVRTRSVETLASLGVPRVRTAGVLFWRELWGALPVTLCWGVVGVLLTNMDRALAKDLQGTEPAILGYLLYFLLTPLAFGLLIAQRDQRARTASFLGDRGISPAAVWWAKQITWFGVALALVTLLAPWRELKRLPRLFDPREPLGDVSQWLSLGGSLFCCLFAAGQLCSFWFRRTVLAWALGCLLVTPIAWWHWLATVAEVPYIATTWPLAALWLAATLLSMGKWLTDSHPKREFLRRAAWIGVPPLLMIGTTIAARARQVPEVDVGTTRAEAVRDLLATDPLAARTWQELQGRFLLIRENETRTGTADEAARDSLTAELEGMVDQLGQGAALGPQLDLNLAMIWPFVLDEGQRLRDAGRSADEFNLYLTALRLDIELTRRQIIPGRWNQSLAERRKVWRQIADWANSGAATEQQLMQAAAQLTEQPELVSVDRNSMLRRWYGAMCLALRIEGPFFPQEELHGGWRVPLARSLLKLSGEAARYERITRFLVYYTQLYREPPADPSIIPYFAAINAEVRHNGKRHPWDDSTYRMPWLDVRDVADMDGETISTLAVQRAAIWTIELQAYRLKHGEFPAHPASALTGDERLPFPWWLGSHEFEFYPEGFPYPVMVTPVDILPAGQPVIWSYVEGASSFRFVEGMSPAETDTPLMYSPQQPRVPLTRGQLPEGGRGIFSLQTDRSRIAFVGWPLHTSWGLQPVPGPAGDAAP